MSADRDPKAWVAKAENDLLSIENNLKGSRVPWDVVAFHAQQAAEKFLKGWLVSRGLDFPKTHDLTYLLEQCEKAGAGFGDLLTDCSRLTVFAIRFRYPVPGNDVTEADGRIAIDLVKRIVGVLRPQIEERQSG